jgi:hypothetical protein
MIDSSISMTFNIITKHLLCCICNMTVSGCEFLSASIDLYIKVINISGDKCTSTNNDTRIRKCNDSRLQKKKKERPVECRLTHYKCTISILYVDLFKHSTYVCICGGKRMKVIVKSSRLTSSQWKTYKKWKNE